MERASRNQIGNLKNPYQGTQLKVLFLCSAGMLRSPTAAQLFCQAPWNWNTRSAGVDTSFALIPVSEALVLWADRIVCMENHHRDILKMGVIESSGKTIWADLVEPKIVVLGIPDMFDRMHTELVNLLKERVSSFIPETK